MKPQDMMQGSTSETQIGAAFSHYLGWLEAIISARMKSYFEGEESEDSIAQLLDLMPQPMHDSPLERTILELDLGPEEVFVLLLAMAPHLRPQILDIFFTKNPVYDRGFVEFGGTKIDPHPGFIPTAETAIFVLCGNDLAGRIRLRGVFAPENSLFKLLILQAAPAGARGSDLGFPLSPTGEYLSYFLSGKRLAPEFGPNFPAKRLETNMEWEDLVVDKLVMDDLMEIQTWLRHADVLMDDWGLAHLLKPGFRSLFYGPPGTGKTLAAALLGKLTGRDVYRIDLSLVVSKYIGETEKNLAAVFDYALEKDWILFFDEADALFGKRTATSSSNDRYANQEVSYLLQRVEDFPGTVILATNFKNNIDEAFMRRFQSVIQFQKPDRHQRLRLWQLAFSRKIPLALDVDLEDLAAKYELTGGEIVNVLRHAALLAVARQSPLVRRDDIVRGIRREYNKDGRLMDSVMD